jgi:hypothetical protein
MELIPILSTIILVATISTFILAVGAYILFKIREGKTQKKPANEPANLYAEYILPNDKKVKKVFVEDIVQTKPKRTFLEDRYRQFSPTEEEKFSKQKIGNEITKEKNVEIPKQKFVNVQTLDSTEQQNELNSGEIKWR